MKTFPKKLTPTFNYSAGLFLFRTLLILIGVLTIHLSVRGFVAGGNYLFFTNGFTLLILGVAAFLMPLEWLLLLGSAFALIADSQFWPSGINFYYTRFVPLALLAIRGLLPLTTHQALPTRLPARFIKPFGLFFLFACFSALYSINTSITLLRTLSMGFILAAFGLAVPIHLKNERQLKRGLQTVLILIALIVMMAPFSAYLLDNENIFLHHGQFTQFQGFFNNPNVLGLLSMLIFFPLVGWWQESVTLKRRLLLLLWGIVLVMLLLSGSRASFVGLLIGLIFFVPLIQTMPPNTKRNIVLLLPLVMLILYFTLSFNVIPRFASTDTGLRPELAKRAFELGMRSPLWGVGFGADDLIAADRPYLQSIGVFSSGTHNSYMRLFIHLGFLGVILFGIGVFRILQSAVRLIRQEHPASIMLTSLVAAIIAGLVNAIFEEWLFGFGGAAAFPFWLFLAVLAISVERYEAEQESSQASARQVESGDFRISSMPSSQRVTQPQLGES